MGPLPVAVTITLIGVTLIDVPIIYGRPNYWMAFGLDKSFLFSLCVFFMCVCVCVCVCVWWGGDVRLCVRVSVSM